jgi:hypothetical protein
MQPQRGKQTIVVFRTAGDCRPSDHSGVPDGVGPRSPIGNKAALPSPARTNESSRSCGLASHPKRPFAPFCSCSTLGLVTDCLALSQPWPIRCKLNDSLCSRTHRPDCLRQISRGFARVHRPCHILKPRAQTRIKGLFQSQSNNKKEDKNAGDAEHLGGLARLIDTPADGR